LSTGEEVSVENWAVRASAEFFKRAVNFFVMRGVLIDWTLDPIRIRISGPSFLPQSTAFRPYISDILQLLFSKLMELVHMDNDDVIQSLNTFSTKDEPQARCIREVRLYQDFLINY
jgi:hypothetical protein